VLKHKTEDFIQNNSCEHEGSYTINSEDNTINSFSLSNCSFNASSNDKLDKLISNCNKTKKPIINGLIGINEPNKITFIGLRFSNLFEIQKACAGNLVYDDDNYTSLIDGKICGYEVSEILELGFSYDNPGPELCSYLY